MMLNKNIFKSKEVTNYVDWGTVREFRNFQRKHISLFVILMDVWLLMALNLEYMDIIQKL